MAKNTTKSVKPAATEGETKPVKAAAAAKPSPAESAPQTATPGKKSSSKSAETSAVATPSAKTSTPAAPSKKAAPETPSSNVKKDSPKPAKKTSAAAAEKPAAAPAEKPQPTTNGSAKKASKKAAVEAVAKPAPAPPAAILRKPNLDEMPEVVIPKKSPFNANFLKKQKQRLTDLRSSLLESMEGVAMDSLRTRPEGSEASVGGMHMGDAGSDAYDRDFALSLLSKEQDALYEINEALKRIDLGSYGICEMTGKPINEERLEALPFTRYTREAQEAIERDQLGGRNRRVPVRSVFGLDDEEEGDDDEEEDSSSKSSNSESSLDFMKD